MPDWQQLFREHPAEYDQLVSREDYQGNIPRALDQICSFEGADVVELGAGTGRFTRALAPVVKSIAAFDVSRPMIEVTIHKLEELELQNWLVGIADHRYLPVGNQVADVAIAGWTICCFPAWQPETWCADVDGALAQMRRVLRPGGTAIILETLGLGESPKAPEKLVAYYARLEEKHGFRYTWIRTDMRYESLAEAEKLTRLFQGDESADKVPKEGTRVIPECTGIWWSIV